MPPFDRFAYTPTRIPLYFEHSACMQFWTVSPVFLQYCGFTNYVSLFMHRRQSRRVITYVTVLRVHVLMKRHDGCLRSPLVAIADVATIATPTHEFSIQMHKLNSFPVRAILLRLLCCTHITRSIVRWRHLTCSRPYDICKCQLALYKVISRMFVSAEGKILW